MVKNGFASQRFEAYRASIFARATAWSSGAPRREGSQPKLLISGDQFAMVAVYTPSYGAKLPARSWWPRSEEEWVIAKPYSFWGVADVGLAADDWSHFRRLSADRAGPHSCPWENLELLSSFPSLLASPAPVQSFAKAGGPPAPPTTTSWAGKLLGPRRGLGQL